MKRAIFPLLVICLTVLLFAFPASAEISTGKCGEQVTWQFDEDTGTMTISGQGAMDTKEYPFWSEYSVTLKHLVIEEGITSINDRAFFSYTGLISVTLPDSLQQIGASAFSGCTSLREIAFGEGLTEIGISAFLFCESLEEVTIPQNVTKIPNLLFRHCRNLTTVNLHEDIESIGSSAFSGCTSLTSIAIPESVTAIKEFTFQDCTSLTQICLPDSIVSIGQGAFVSCSSLREITIGSGLSTIEKMAFDDCTALSTIRISADNPYYYSDQSAVYNKEKTELLFIAPGLGEYSILPGTTTIRDRAAEGCVLTKITIPESITEISPASFSSCEALTEVNFPNSLVKIGENAFAHCSALAEITFPSNLAAIESSAFYNCSSLKKITFTGNAPEFASHCFLRVTADAYYLPHHANWKDSRESYGGQITWIPLSDGEHTLKITKAIPSTCTKAGTSESHYCTVCGLYIVEPTPLPLADHVYGPWVEITTPTEQSLGLRQRTCTHCGKVEEQILAQLNPAEPTTPPTEPTEPQETTPTEPSVTEPPATVPSATEPAETSPTEPVNNTPAKDTNTTLILVIALAAITVVAGIIIAITVYKRNKS